MKSFTNVVILGAICLAGGALSTPLAAQTGAPAPTSDSLERRIAIMKTDLRKLVTAEEAFYADSVRYSRSLAEIQFVPAPGDIVKIDTLRADDWSGTATSSGAPGWTCGIYVGKVRPHTPDQKEGIPKCWKSP